MHCPVVYLAFEAVEVLLIIEEEAPSASHFCFGDLYLRNTALTPFVDLQSMCCVLSYIEIET